MQSDILFNLIDELTMEAREGMLHSSFGSYNLDTSHNQTVVHDELLEGVYAPYGKSILSEMITDTARGITKDFWWRYR